MSEDEDDEPQEDLVEKERIIKKLKDKIKRETKIGIIETKGSNDGNQIYMGRFGGIYYYTQSSGKKVYLNVQEVLKSVKLSITNL